jgi:hypothetical protein
VLPYGRIIDVDPPASLTRRSQPCNAANPCENATKGSNAHASSPPGLEPSQMQSIELSGKFSYETVGRNAGSYNLVARLLLLPQQGKLDGIHDDVQILELVDQGYAALLQWIVDPGVPGGTGKEDHALLQVRRDRD